MTLIMELGNHCEFAVNIYQSYLFRPHSYFDINLFKFTFTVVFNYLGVDEVGLYIAIYGLGKLSSALAGSASKVCPRLTSLAASIRTYDSEFQRKHSSKRAACRSATRNDEIT